MMSGLRVCAQTWGACSITSPSPLILGSSDSCPKPFLSETPNTWIA